MSLLEIFMIAVGLSMDAFAVAVCAGVVMPGQNTRNSIIVGLYFGIFQAIMPIGGFFMANRFAGLIYAYSHWAAFGVLAFIGGKMIFDSFKKNDGQAQSSGGQAPSSGSLAQSGSLARSEGSQAQSGSLAQSEGSQAQSDGASLGPAHMLPLALATSVDAMAVGVTFAFLRVNIMPAALIIGAVTLVLAIGGVKIGAAFGARFKAKAELAGGTILVLIGLRMLIMQLFTLSL